MRLIRGNVERIAETEAQIAKLKAEGFKEMGATAKDEQPKKAIAEMSVTELKALAREKGLEGCSGLSKEELLAILKDVV